MLSCSFLSENVNTKWLHCRICILLNYRCIWCNVSTHLVVFWSWNQFWYCFLPSGNMNTYVSSAFLLNSILNTLFILTYSEMHICFQKLTVKIFHCYCVTSVGYQDITLFSWLLWDVFCFAGQNRWMFEANRSKCSPYIYQQCYCFLYGCPNPYSCFTSIFTPGKLVCCSVSSYDGPIMEGQCWYPFVIVIVLNMFNAAAVHWARMWSLVAIALR